MICRCKLDDDWLMIVVEWCVDGIYSYQDIEVTVFK
jgi:hypothetical protein